MFYYPLLNLIKQWSRWVGRMRADFWGPHGSVIIEVTKPIVPKEACFSFHIQDTLMGYIFRSQRIESSVQISHHQCQDCISRTHILLSLWRTVTHWSFEAEFACIQIFFHQEAFLIPQDWEVRKLPVLDSMHFDTTRLW